MGSLTASSMPGLAMRVVGLDFGLKRIGLAAGDPSGTLASPVETIAAGATADETARRVLAAIRALEAQGDPVGVIVVGLPAHLDGSPSEETGRAREFGEALRAAAGREVVYVDERLTSREAEARLALRERDWRARKRRLDAAAAAVILQDYLDSQPKPGRPDEEHG